MTISTALAAEIRRLFFAEHWKRGTIADQLSVHFDTVARVLGSFGPKAGTPRPDARVLEPYVTFVDQTLARHPRLVATRIFDMIVGRGYTGSLKTLRRYVRTARPVPKNEVFLRVETLPELFELQAWLGHGSPASTQHYVAITPTKLAKAYADAGYFERNMRAIDVLVDQDAIKQAAAGEPWRFYDLGHGFCSYEFFDQCAHRMACARCDLYRPGESDLVQLMAAKTNILRLKQELPLTDEEKAVVDGDLVAIEKLTRKLADRPTPSGQTPTELRCCGGGGCSRSLIPDST